MKSPLDFGGNSLPGSPNSPLKGDNKKKKKANKGVSVFKNPIFKEIMPVSIYATVSLALVGGAFFYTNSVEPSYALSNFEKIERVESLEGQVELLMQQKGSLSAQLENSQAKLDSLSLTLEEQNMMKTPLTQGYYFLSYFTYLTEKYKVDLHRLSVLASDGSGEIDLATVSNAVGGYDLLPIEVEFTTDTDSLRGLLDEMYTKRIIQVKNLSTVNNMDGHLRVKFQVFFTDTEAIMKQQEQIQDVTGATDVTEEVNSAVDDSGATTDATVTDPSVNSGATNSSGTEVNTSGNYTEEQIEQHYQETGEVIDPVSGDVLN